MQKKKTKPKSLSDSYGVQIGDRFYHNNYSTRKGHALPDYLIIKEIKDGFITATYLNHYVYTKERVFSDAILNDSNLNPKETNPQWIFSKPQILQSS